MSFGLDSQTENWLTQRGIQFEYREAIRFSELAPNWMAINQGRPDGMSRDDDVILNYASAMVNRSIFPAPILAKAADGYEVLDGIQRLLAAHTNDESMFNGYIVKSDHPAVRASIRICANSNLNGKSPTLEWTTSRVVDVLYEQHRMSPTDCAIWSGIHPRNIEAEINSRDGARWMETHDIDTTIKPANLKGFRAVFAAKFPIVEREKVARVLPKIVKELQKLRCGNEEAELLLNEITDFKPDKRFQLADQLQQRFEEVISRPDIEARAIGRRKLHPIDLATRSIAAAVTNLRSVVTSGQTTDPEQSARVVELVYDLRELARKAVPKEHWGSLQYGPKHE